MTRTPKNRKRWFTTAGVWKPNKFGARKCMVGQYVFDSAREAARYKDLKVQELAGRISELELQPSFLLQEGYKYNGETIRPIKYIADFRYKKEGKIIIEDVKGLKTSVYQLKKKLLLKKYPDINFIET